MKKLLRAIDAAGKIYPAGMPVVAAPPAVQTVITPRVLRPQNGGYQWLMPQLAAITPQYIEQVLRGALAGNHVQQAALFRLMLDSWPELASCVQELALGVAEKTPAFTAYAEEDEAPTPQAEERKRLVAAALRTMQPDPATDENGLDGTIRDIVHAWFCGTSVQEILWHPTGTRALGSFIAPRCTVWADPSSFAWGTDGVLGLSLGNKQSTINNQQSPPAPFPENKFLVATHKAVSGFAPGSAMLRPLAFWWMASTFASDWVLNLAQLFGIPFRWATYDRNSPAATQQAICAMMQNMGSQGWAAFPEGTTMNFLDAGKGSDHSPQGELLDRADRYARGLILGQTMSGSQDASKGGGKAFGSVESGVKASRIDSAAKFVATVLKNQLVDPICILNYGDAEEAPTVSLETASEEDLQVKATIIQTLATAGAGSVIGLDYIGKKFDIPKPAEGELTLEDGRPAMSPFGAFLPGGERGAGSGEQQLTPGITQQEEDDEDEDEDEDEIAAKLAGLADIEDDALFSKSLTALAGKPTTK